MKRIIISTVVAAALGAVCIVPQNAEAAWIGSGWQSLNAGHGFSVVGSNGGTYSAIFAGTSSSAASYNSTGAVDGLPTCDEAAILCANENFIVAPYLCENSTGGSGTITSTAQVGANSQGHSGTYWVWQGGNNWLPGTDTGACPAGFPGILAGVYLWQY
jgi:hypothetical protein